MRSLCFVLLLFYSATTVAAQSSGEGLATAPSPAKRNGQIVERSPGARDAFKVESDGKIRHLQSGALCPAGFPNLAFAAAQIYPSAGTGLDVGCDYGRAGPNGYYISKLTIFFVQASKDDTLDSIFARYQQEIATTHPGAKATPSSLKITDEASNQTRTDYRSMSYTFSFGGRPARSELIVGLFKGWILKIRSTSFTDIAVREENKDEDVRHALFDSQSPLHGGAGFAFEREWSLKATELSIDGGVFAVCLLVYTRARTLHSPHFAAVTLAVSKSRRSLTTALSRNRHQMLFLV